MLFPLNLLLFIIIFNAANVKQNISQKHFLINNTMRASQFINESPLKDLENRLPKIKSDQYDVDEKGKIYRNAKSASKQAHKARQELTASDQMFDDDLNIEDEAQKGADWMGERLQIENMPKIVISYDTEEAQEGHHTGKHEMGSDEIWVYGNRNLIDIMRTVFHELVHIRQGEKDLIKAGDSYPGSPIEAAADMVAGKYIKIYGKENPHIFQ